MLVDEVAMLHVTVDNQSDKISSQQAKINELEGRVSFLESYITGSINPPSIQEGDTPEELLV